MKLKERIKSLSGNVKEEKIKRDLEEIETINIELDHRVTKLVAENEHLKRTYKQLYDSIKSSRVRSKEQCDDLIKQVNIMSAENSDLNASLQEKVLNSRNSEESNLSTSNTIVEVPKELPKVSMVNSSLKMLKFHLASFDMAVEQYYVEKNKFQDKMKDILKKNERLLEQAISTEIVNIVVNANVNYACKTVNECERCATIETELQRDFIKKECYDKLFKQYTTLEKHYISLEVDTQLKQEILQRNNSFLQQSALTFDQLFKKNNLKAQSQEKNTIIMKLKEKIKSLSGNVKEEKIKRDLEEIETINIELDHRVTKLVAENEHLKQ
nr:reverse transcriptase zinc-binding domain-containing protein [Tanacetum cinerariifolium]